jgi:Uma2 family endonuclease
VERHLRPVEASGYHLHIQLPVTLAGIQEPKPDIAVVRGSPEDYPGRHPGPPDIEAVIEVSDSTLDYDPGIGLYWIINLPESQIEVYEQPLPQEGRYAVRTDYHPGQTLRLRLDAALLELAVADVLPPAGAAQG